MKVMLLLVTHLVWIIALVAIGTLVSGYLAIFLFGMGAAVGLARELREGVVYGRGFQILRDRNPALFRFVAILHCFTTFAMIVVPILHWLGLIYVDSPR